MAWSHYAPGLPQQKGISGAVDIDAKPRRFVTGIIFNAKKNAMFFATLENIGHFFS